MGPLLKMGQNGKAKRSKGRLWASQNQGNQATPGSENAPRPGQPLGEPGSCLMHHLAGATGRECLGALGMNRIWGFPNTGNHRLDWFLFSFPAYRTSKSFGLLQEKLLFNPNSAKQVGGAQLPSRSLAGPVAIWHSNTQSSKSTATAHCG